MYAVLIVLQIDERRTTLQYTCFFDESFHDRKIVVNQSGEINTIKNDGIDNYIGVFWGCKTFNLSENIGRIFEFESKYKKMLGLSDSKELKTTTFARKFYRYGVKSFSQIIFDFYNDFIVLLDQIAPIIQINSISKVEMFLRRIFHNNIQFSPNFEVNQNVFYYTITKFILTYQNKDMLQALYNASSREGIEKLRETLICHLRTIRRVTKEIERKELERRAYQQLIQVLRTFSLKPIETKVDFSYVPNFEGLCNLLEEMHISPSSTNLILDKEDHTYSTALAYNFRSISQGASDQIIGIRVSDWLSGLIGRFIYAMRHDKSNMEDQIISINDLQYNDLSSKRLLSPEWFDLSEIQYQFYCKMYQTLIVRHQKYWTVLSLSYNEAILFFAFIRYISYYPTYEEYQKVPLHLHPEYYNFKVCKELEDYYQQL